MPLMSESERSTSKDRVVHDDADDDDEPDHREAGWAKRVGTSDPKKAASTSRRWLEDGLSMDRFLGETPGKFFGALGDVVAIRSGLRPAASIRYPPIMTVGQPPRMEPPWAVVSPIRAAGMLLIITVAEPLMMMSGGPTQTHWEPRVADGMPPMRTVGPPGLLIGPPT